jgi:hypothetical protein
MLPLLFVPLGSHIILLEVLFVLLGKIVLMLLLP